MGTEDVTGLHASIEFFCTGASAGTFDMDFEHDSSTDTLLSHGPEQVWHRTSLTPW